MVGKNDKLASYTQTHIGQLFLSRRLSSGIMGKKPHIHVQAVHENLTFYWKLMPSIPSVLTFIYRLKAVVSKKGFDRSLLDVQ